MNRQEVGSSHFSDELWLAEPLRVGADFVLGHGGECVHLAGEPADPWNFANEVHESQKRGSPGFHEDHEPGFSQDALHLRKGLLQVSGQIGQVMQAALHDEDILRAV